jgi:two-component system, sensor histidine kinase ChiS
MGWSFSTLPLHAHNGSSAVALPAGDIAIDGDFADWPEGARWYPLDVPGIGLQPSPEDFSGRFALAYNEEQQALYVAIEVEDDSLVPEPLPNREDPWWEASDGCEIYIDIKHGEDTRAIQYALYGEKPSTAYSSAMAMAGWKGVEFGIQREGGTHRYEWRVDVAQIAEAEGQKLRGGTSIGFDVSAVDRDADGSFSWMAWGEGTVKVRFAASRGDVVLAKEEMGVLQGRVERAQGGGGLAHRSVVIERLGGAPLRVVAHSDRQGQLAVELPPGGYVLTDSGTDTTRVDIAAATTVQADVLLAPPPGKKTLAGPGRSVEIGAGTRDGLWHSLGVSDGLGGGMVLQMVQDRLDRLWLATTKLSRYDGRFITTFDADDGLPLDQVYSVAQDSSGHIWIGSYEQGVVRYDGTHFTQFTVEDGLGSNQIMDIEVDARGDVWLATFGGGAVRYDGAYFERFTTRDGLGNNTLLDVFQAPDGALWFGTWGGGISRYDGGKFTTLTTADGLLNDTVNGIAADAHGHLWVGHHDGLSRHDGEDFVHYTPSEGLAHPTTYGVEVDRMGQVWAASNGGGLSVLQDSGSIKVFTTADGLPSNAFHAAVEDREGNMWLGSPVGLVRYGGSLFRSFALDGEGIRALWRSRDGAVWAGTIIGGVFRCTKEGCTAIELPKKLGSYPINSILEDRQGRMYFASQGAGIARYDEEGFTVFDLEHGLPSNDIVKLYEDRQGDVWAGTAIGIMRYRDGVWQRVGEEVAALRGLASAIYQDRRGHMWFSVLKAPSTTGQGVVRYDGEQWRVFTTADGLGDDAVTSILETRAGEMLFGSKGGLAHFDGENWEQLTAQDGLASERVLSLLEDEGGRIWMGTAVGISLYDGRTVQNLTKADGPISDYVRALVADGEGGYWLGGIEGLVYYRPQPASPRVQLLDVVGERRYGPVESLRLPATENYLAFEFYGRSFKTRAGELVYRHRLLGLEEAWINSKEERVEYFDLPMGSYTFEVEAVDRDLGYSLEPLRVQVEIHFPYRQTALWISLSLVLGMLGLVVGRVYQRRQMRLRVAEERSAVLEQANEKLREADQLKSDFVAHVSHELRTPLTAIKGAVGNMLDGITGEYDERQMRYLNRLENNADQLSALIEDLLDLSRIEAGQLRLMRENVDMVVVCRSALEGLMGLAERRGIALRMAEVSGVVEVVADADRVRQVLVNLLGNALKFTSSGGEVVLGVEREQAGVRVWVRDTGEGIPAAEIERVFEKFHQARNGLEQGVRGAGIGLSIARQLVELHGGRIWVESQEGVGSTFVFTLPDEKVGE